MHFTKLMFDTHKFPTICAYSAGQFQLHPLQLIHIFLSISQSCCLRQTDVQCKIEIPILESAHLVSVDEEWSSMR